MDLLITAIAFLLIFSVLVLIHEWGHFTAARRAGVKVEEFGFGLPPRIWGKKKGETIYSINWIPFGGFVKLLGEDASDDKLRKNKRSYSNKSPWVRLWIVTAGVVMNLFLCWFLLTVGFSIGIQPLIVEPEQFLEAIEDGSIKTEPGFVVQEVKEGTQAEAEGVKAGDVLLTYNGESILELDAIAGQEAGTFEILGEEERMVEFLPGDVVLYPMTFLPRVKVYGDGQRRGDLHVGDYVIEMNGEILYNTTEFFAGMADGDNVLTVLRDGKEITVETVTASAEQKTGGVVVDYVLPGTPASDAGFKSLDKLLAINDEGLTMPEDVIERNQANPGVASIYTIRRGEEVFDAEVTPDENGLIGVQIAELMAVEGLGVSVYDSVAPLSVLEIADVQYPVWIAPIKAVEETGKLAILTVDMFGQVVRQLVTQFTVPDGVAGPVGIAQMTHTVVQEGFGSLLRFMALLSLSLAIINIFPFPALDGGRAFFILIEVIFKQRLRGRAEAIVHAAGFIFLMGLIIAVTYSDIVRWISGS